MRPDPAAARADVSVAAQTGARSFAQWVHLRVAQAPHHLAVVDGPQRLTRGQLHAQAQRLGGALKALGLPAGAAIAFQLPNWHEACVVHLAASLYGFKLVPLLPMYREAELALILSECAVQALFLPQSFRNVCYPDLFSRVRQESVKAGHVFVVRGHDARYASYDTLLASAPPALEPTPAEPDAVKMVLYTSGSTGKPKGVLHSGRSLDALIRFAADFWCLSETDVALVPSPVGHIGGSMYAFDFPWVIGMTAVLMDVWSPERALEVIRQEDVSFCAGATPFLDGLLKAARSQDQHLPSLRRFICGGASVPPTLIEQASLQFRHCTVSRAYGSTEVPLVSAGIRSRDDAAFGASTDGECAAELRIIGDAGQPLAAGTDGDIVARAPRMFVGYLDAQDNTDAFTPDGFFRMGDIGRLVAGRFIEIRGRRKDIIIRQGENISPLEVENVLAEHPAVKQVAIVGIPDARTGEAALAFVVLHDGARFTLADMSAFLAQRGLARHKFPEHLRLATVLPTNSIGKVLKRELRHIALSELMPAESGVPRTQ